MCNKTKTSKVLCKEKDCEKCFKRSFASFQKSKYWSKENTKEARELCLHSNKKAWFDCICDHAFEMIISDITRGRWCPYCSEPPKKLCSADEECKICFDKSFASHWRSKFWSEKNEVKPEEVFLSTAKKYFFDCNCGHIFNVSPNNIKNGNWCSFCAKKKLCSINEECKTCFDKSFASHWRSKFWSEKNDVRPEEIFRSSNKKHWFRCEENHLFQMSPSSITNSGQFCPICKNKTEKKVYEFLFQSFGKEIIREAVFDWCINLKTNRHFRFDFCIEKYKIIIEIDGIQHFEEVRGWKTCRQTTFTKDIFKMKKAFENGYTVLRFFQPDVYADKIEWRRELINCIRTYENTTYNFFGQHENIYDEYKKALFH